MCFKVLCIVIIHHLPNTFNMIGDHTSIAIYNFPYTMIYSIVKYPDPVKQAYTGAASVQTLLIGATLSRIINLSVLCVLFGTVTICSSFALYLLS